MARTGLELRVDLFLCSHNIEEIEMYLLFLFTFAAVENSNEFTLRKGLTYGILIGAVSTIISDAGMEYYYAKYRNADTPSECKRYRNRTQLLETSRNVSIVTTGVSLGGLFLIDLIKGKDKDEKFNLNIKPSKFGTIEVNFAYLF